MVDKEKTLKCCVHTWRVIFIILNSIFLVSWPRKYWRTGLGLVRAGQMSHSLCAQGVIQLGAMNNRSH